MPAEFQHLYRPPRDELVERIGPFVLWPSIAYGAGVGGGPVVVAWVLRGPYVKGLPARLRALGGRWRPVAKVWELPAEAGDELRRLLEREAGRFRGRRDWTPKQRRLVEDLLYRRIPAALRSGDEGLLERYRERLCDLGAHRHPETAEIMRVVEALEDYKWTLGAARRRIVDAIARPTPSNVSDAARILIDYVHEVKQALAPFRGNPKIVPYVQAVVDFARDGRRRLAAIRAELRARDGGGSATT